MRTQTEVGAAIRDWRKSNRYSQEDLADLLGVSQGYVSQMERGEAFSTLPLLIAVADLMEVSLDDLVGRDNHRPQDYTADQRTLHALLSAILDISTDDRAKLLEIIKLYAKSP